MSNLVNSLSPLGQLNWSTQSTFRHEDLVKILRRVYFDIFIVLIITVQNELEPNKMVKILVKVTWFYLPYCLYKLITHINCLKFE
ncbi:hypothetical protein Hanom_Chr16g01430731 [Helianthus anomalus]